MNTQPICRPPDDPRVEIIDFSTSDGLQLFFRRGRRSSGGQPEGPPILMIHGGSASGDTFLAPRGESIFDFLLAKGRDIWLLDWSASHYIADSDPIGANRTLDDAARIDIAEAVDFVFNATDKTTVSVLAHCLGAACLSMAIGGGHILPGRIHRVLLATIGLFYEVAWDGWAKTQDRLLDRMATCNPPAKISPADAKWHEMLEELYEMWPEAWGPRWEDEFFKRLAFMFGQPFLPSNLHPDMTREVLRQQFGSFPFKLFQHAGQNAIRGFAGSLDAEGSLPSTTPNDRIRSTIAETYLRPERFRDLHITLLTGGGNPLWHRDSIDRMAEWLGRNGDWPQKFVLPGYGHQDLWWGPKSSTDVFPRVFDALI